MVVFVYKKIRVFFLFLTICFSSVYAQKFSALSGSDYPFTNLGPTGYQGASFVDFDRDNDVDIYITGLGLYENVNGAFSLITNSGIGNGVGHSWGDVDNDGDLDIFQVGANGFLYINNGDNTFSISTNGDLADAGRFRAWSCAFADIDNDGWLDVATNHPAGFIPPVNIPTTNQLLHNQGAPSFDFVTLDSTIISNGFQPYTVGTWSDYDQDGDVDYFIGSGPASGVTAVDFLYKNLFVENGSIGFERILDSPIGTDLQDGQVWNWIDYDNDGDLDAYLTNWVGARNRLYRNDNGTFIAITGIPMVTDAGSSLASIWADYDNDGDLDCYVGNDGGVSDRYYRNNGDGTFTDIDTLVFQNASTRRSGSASDFDNDGDIDLLLSGPGSSMKLYRNELKNTNSWLKIRCEGVRSNRAAINTILRTKAQINGNSVWQMREISAQNSFNSQNDLQVHFGYGDAMQIDSLIVEWPSGINQTFTSISVNQTIDIIEDTTLVGIENNEESAITIFTLAQNYPNPFNPQTTIEYTLLNTENIQLNIYNIQGQLVRTLVNIKQTPGNYSVIWDGKNELQNTVTSGIYFYKLSNGKNTKTRKMIFLK